MRGVVRASGWFFFAIDAVAAAALLQWAMTAGERDGEIAYAVVLLLSSLVWLALGGGGLVWSGRRGSWGGLWLSTLFLGVPPMLALVLRVLNSL